MSISDTSNVKHERLRRLSTPAGIIGALAIDQRRSLRRLIADAGGRAFEQVPDSDLAAFKECISEVLTPHASAILFDTEYGLEAARKRAQGCGLLLAYELDGYENPRPHRMLALMPDLSAERLAELGADGVKILLHYSPEDSAETNDAKFAMIERIGAECATVGLPFFLEPLLYDPAAPLLQSEMTPQARAEHAFDFARRKPAQVVEMMRKFSRPRYRVDILKVEFPVVAQFVEGSATFRDRRAFTHEEALAWYRAADEAAGLPYIYLSAGVSSQEFLQSIRYALEAKTRFSGVLCGRATWQDGVRAFAAEGVEAFRLWLGRYGAANIEALNELLVNATPWEKFAATAPHR